jgi:hypothetical protein
LESVQYLVETMQEFEKKHAPIHENISK